MNPDTAALIIQRAWKDYCYSQMYEQQDNDVNFNDMYPDRPVDYEGMEEVENYYRDLYTYGSF